jgi:beta-glucosidase
MAATSLASRGLQQVRSPALADVAILRIRAPHEELHPGFFFGSRQQEGALDFKADSPELKQLAQASRAVPTIVVVSLDRPAILKPLQDTATALIGDFGASDDAVLDVLVGKARPEGRLPFELPSSMSAVEAQRPDAPHDSENPLYPISFGLRYR